MCSRQDLRLEGLWLLGSSSDSVFQAPLLTQTRLITQSALHRAPHYNSCCRRKYRSVGWGRPRSVGRVCRWDKRRWLALRGSFSRLLSEEY